MTTPDLNQTGVPPSAFPTLESDIPSGVHDSHRTTKRICIATNEILGAPNSGGIGTACHHMAKFLAEQGHDVVIAFVHGNAVNEEMMTMTRALYDVLGVAFEPIAPFVEDESQPARILAPSCALLDWLRALERPFDVVNVPSNGLGYSSLLAKSLGIAFAETHFVVQCHGALLWIAEASRQLLRQESQLGVVFMEQRSVELADTVISGSACLLEWMRDAGHALPARSFVWPNVFPVPESPSTAVGKRNACGDAYLKELVFFGRLQELKGLMLFVDALDRLARQGRIPARVTFLGRPVGRFDGIEYIRNGAADWPTEISTTTEFGPREAVSYLSEPGRLAVMPSLVENSSMAVVECLQAEIPFVATAVGGTPELVAPEDHARALVAPDYIALGDRIAELAREPLRAIRPQWDFARLLEVWARWHGQSVAFDAAADQFARKSRMADAQTPLVTVCITHHERPELVRMAVDSVYAQDYPSLEAVLVDDGSEGANAVATLDVIESEFGERGWQVVRQENRYLGAARNAAATVARGEWLLFLDDDNVMFPDAVSRLVRAARCSGADCVTAASIRFFGDGDPRTDPSSHGAPILHLGAARAWSRIRNVVGDAFALVSRQVFEAVGGFPEEYRVGGEDIALYNRLIQANHHIEPLPDPVYYYRIGETSQKSRNRSAEAAQLRVIAPYLAELPHQERAFLSLVVARVSSVHLTTPSELLRRLAWEATRRRYWTLACDLWSEYRDANPVFASGYREGVQALMKARRFDEALDLADDAVRRFPHLSDCHIRRAELAMRLRNWDDACERWSEMRRLFPHEHLAYEHGVLSLMNAGRLDEAAALAEEAVRWFPSRPHAHLRRAEVATRRRDWPLACELWAYMRRSFPAEPSGFVRGAGALLEAGRLDECELVAIEAVNRFPGRRGGYYHRAGLAMRRREWGLACELWAEVRRAFPDDASGFVRGTLALMNAGRLVEAEELANEAVERFPERPNGHLHRAELAMRRSDWGMACERWGEMRRLFPDNAPGYVRGVVALMNAGRLDDATAVADEAVRRFPENSDVRRRRPELAGKGAERARERDGAEL